MWSVVIPARNEAGRIGQVLDNLLPLPWQKIIVVANGCTDGTLAEIGRCRDQRLELSVFSSPLGVDVPRAVGAKIALDGGAAGVLFVDGDMTGQFKQQLEAILIKLEEGWDMALLNCYPYIPYRHPLAALTTFYRAKLNRRLELFQQLGIASPSHGPHGLSRRLLQVVPFRELAIPPMALALASRAGLQIGVAAGITHQELQSYPRDEAHGKLIAETILGDHLEALAYTEGRPRSRLYHGQAIMGYHPRRRWDLLHAFLHPQG